MGLISSLVRRALFQLDAETAHALAITGLNAGQFSHLLPGKSNSAHKQLSVKIAGLEFPNPIGVAAGFDKNGEVPDALLKLGFGFTEVGTVTPLAQAGNPRPRIFRLPQDRAVINRLGFNNRGHEYVFNQLSGRKNAGKTAGIVGVNIGANKDSDDFVRDYQRGIEKFWELADYFTINISSPNTPGLRNLQAQKALDDLLARICSTRDQQAARSQFSPPLLLKIAPDLNEKDLDDIAASVVGSNIAGLIISNTTIQRTGIHRSGPGTPGAESGGLSGRPLFVPSTIILAKLRQRVGDTMPIIGVGGIDDLNSAVEKFEAGANLLQLYTGMIYNGPAIADEICQGLANLLKKSSLNSIAELTGTKTNEWAAREVVQQR